ncbi:hypothetical protein EIP91_007079 [Steccherinum ochraceum]|uniref:NRPS-like protein biosynthetic cluster n=1 Tax=Steccherinum ochraceum TaxID=92696 RepID=A0A4R0R4U6_9APHY|nr:hypothetical protein EIP91_007079 [Steccherinum ochraceum]
MYLKSLYPPVPPTPQKNVHEFIFSSPTKDLPNHVAHLDVVTGRKRTRREVEEYVRDAATALGSPVLQGGMGLSGEAGDIVGICSGNCMNYVTLLQACLVITTPFAPISSYSTHMELVHALRLTGITRVFVQPSILPRMLAATKEVGIPQDHVYILEGQGVDGRKSLDDIVEDARAKRIPRLPVRPATHDTLAYLIFSSGTTGLPKAVMISHGNIYFTLLAGQIFTPPVPPVVLAVLPFHHTYGLQMFAIRCVIDQTTLAIVPKWDAKIVLSAIPKYKVNVFLLVPSMLHQLVTSGLLDKADLSSVWSVATGAAYLPPKVEEKFMSMVKQIPRVSQGYGLSECTLSGLRKPVPGCLGGRQPARGSAGILLPGMEARLLREDGTDVGFNEPGEVWLKGGNIALGYFKNEKATKETFIDGWLRTGDRFQVDEQENFYFIDRIKDILKVGGVQVSPTEIEEVLRMHPDKLLADVCVAGVSGGRTSDELVPRAWFVLSEEGKRFGVEKTVRELEEWTHKNLSKYKWLRGGVEVVDSIPKSPTGKVLRRKLQDKFEAELAARQGAKSKL